MSIQNIKFDLPVLIWVWVPIVTGAQTYCPFKYATSTLRETFYIKNEWYVEMGSSKFLRTFVIVFRWFFLSPLTHILIKSKQIWSMCKSTKVFSKYKRAVHTHMHTNEESKRKRERERVRKRETMISTIFIHKNGYCMPDVIFLSWL